MIVSNLQNSSRVEGLHPLFKTLFDYIKKHDLLHAVLGRIDIEGDDLFILNINPECIAEDEQPLEVHHKYIDVHILLEGSERIGWKAIEDVRHEIKPYDEEGDCALYKEQPTMWVDLCPGQFMIVYPEDPHAPVIGSGKIRKLIAKVKI
ncbi:YhcH/YjgK/YiaL family protein [Bacteroides sp. GD17]|jgi:biofilm protein TabA|uniref:YhcH/YjgK/YiaL family protein n=1 Tax=Bacteroides sp. GD17 TaxID=3139826 RepID=UPI0025D87E42|nr:YhcH/YjgK/YiaL family protein [uncultured Bacteroides sp.]